MPEQQGSSVLTTISTNSAAEAFARRENMDTEALRVPRMSDIDVTALPMSTAYPEDTANLDTVLLEAVKFGSRVVVPYEQLDDSTLESSPSFRTVGDAHMRRRLTTLCSVPQPPQTAV